mmetsp:Transcript_5432/g.8868  ORF Transcript_5432/g.8868 Transcript_5432/m.8868 type:complete len:140 (-) Transcript_5432:146-565(-)
MGKSKVMNKGRVCMILQGRFAGCKGVIVETREPSRKHKFLHCVVAGISKAPRRVNPKMERKTIMERSKISTFVKVINQRHLMPTRYRLNMRVKGISVKSLNPKDGKKKQLRRDIRRKLTRMYFKNGEPATRWFFKKLYF